MKAAHAAASSNLYRARNAAAPQGFIDLHGLHVKVLGIHCMLCITNNTTTIAYSLQEALEVLDRELSGHTTRHAMQICVGTGSHTKARPPWY